MNPLVLVVDDEPDVEVLFRQQFRRDLRTDRFTMEFAQSAPMALQRITDAGNRSLILILSDINMPGMSGLELLPKGHRFTGRRACVDETDDRPGLCSPRERPSRRRTAEQRDELAPLHGSPSSRGPHPTTSLNESSVLHHSKFSGQLAAMGLGCVKTLYRKR